MLKTNQLMQRDFDGVSISQRTKDSYFNATELLNVYNSNSDKQKTIKDFWGNKGTDDFMTSLVNQLNSEVKLNGAFSPYLENDLFSAKKGRGGQTYMHPYLFVKFAMWLSTDFEVKVIRWVYDNLIDFRIQAGDHYKEMCSTIQERYIEYYGSSKIDPLVFVNEATYLNELVFGNNSVKRRNDATEKELDLMNKLQLANIKLIKSGIGKDERKNQLRIFANLYK
jgi:hypothetical protein